MKVSAACIRCMADRQEERIQRRTDLDEQIKAKYMKAVLRVIGESKDGTSAPELVGRNLESIRVFLRKRTGIYKDKIRT